LDDSARRSLEASCVPHLRAAYNLARWLARDEHEAADVVQEASLRAVKYFEGASEIADARAWFLRIVRNTFYSSRSRAAPDRGAASFDEALHTGARDPFNPEATALRDSDREVVRAALRELALDFREALVLREIEGLSYKEIGAITGVPIGTVMSRLARARRALAEALARRTKKERSS